MVDGIGIYFHNSTLGAGSITTVPCHGNINHCPYNRKIEIGICSNYNPQKKREYIRDNESFVEKTLRKIRERKYKRMIEIEDNPRNRIIKNVKPHSFRLCERRVEKVRKVIR